MVRTLLQIVLLLVVGLIGYNYFFGTAGEKEQSREIVGKVKDLGSDAWNLLKSEREKMRQGKYDDALTKLDALYADLKDRARRVKDSDALDRLRELDARREALQRTIEKDGKELSREARRKLKDLTEETEALMNEMEAESRSGTPR